LVLDLVFTQPSSTEFNWYYSHPDWRLSSDYAPITINISIRDEDIPIKWRSLIKGGDEENQFIEDLIQFITNLNTSSIQDVESLEEVV